MDHAVVLAGGSGTRFWPESRMRRSKQFLNLTGEGPMIAETVRRLLPLVPRENIWVVAGEKDSPHLSARGVGVPPREILLEPHGRETTHAAALAAARTFLGSGRFDWNSGVFLVRAATYRDRMPRFLPPVHRKLERAVRDPGKKGFRDRLHRAYAGMPSVSVDYGILEKEDGILVIPSEFGWNDIGTWRSLHEFLGTGKNVTAGNVILADCRGALGRSDRGVIAVIGMEDVVVVRNGDAVLVCPRHRSEEVKGIAEEVRRKFPGLA